MQEFYVPFSLLRCHSDLGFRTKLCPFYCDLEYGSRPGISRGMQAFYRVGVSCSGTR